MINISSDKLDKEGRQKPPTYIYNNSRISVGDICLTSLTIRQVRQARQVDSANIGKTPPCLDVSLLDSGNDLLVSGASLLAFMPGEPVTLPGFDVPFKVRATQGNNVIIESPAGHHITVKPQHLKRMPNWRNFHG